MSVARGAADRRVTPAVRLCHLADGFTARRFVDLSRTKSMMCRASTTWR